MILITDMVCEQNTDMQLKDDRLLHSCPAHVTHWKFDYASTSRVKFISPSQLECFFLRKKHQYLPTLPFSSCVCRADGLLA
jgi:hypothetical protein